MSLLALLWLCLRTLFVAVALPLLIGFGATQLLPSLRRAQPTLPQHFYLGFLGGGMLGILLYAAGVPRWLMLSAIGLLSLVGLPALVQAMRKLPKNRLTLIVSLLLIPLLVSGVVYCCWDLVTGEDASILWLARVRVLQAWVPAGQLASLEVAQPSYPFLGPFWWWLVTETARVPVEAGRVVFLVAYLFFFLDLASVRDRSWPVAVLIAALAFAFFREEWISGYQDGLVMIFFAWSAWILSRQSPQHALAFVPFIACIAGIKFEGGVLAVILVSAWGVFRLRTLLTPPLRWRAIASAVVLLVVPALWPLMLKLGGAKNTSVQGGTFSGINAHWLVDQGWRVPVIARDIMAGTNATFWILVVACLAGAVVLLRRRASISAWLLLAIVLHLSFLIVVFWSTHAPFEWHVMTALNRLQWQAALLWVVWLMNLVEPPTSTAPVHWSLDAKAE